jgi:thiamine biosynthesis lipoprotein
MKRFNSFLPLDKILQNEYNLICIMRKLLLIFTLTVLFVLCSCRETADTQTFFALDTAVSVSVSGDSAEETAAALRDEIISVGESAALCFKTTAEGALPAVSELVSKTEALNSHYGYDVNIFCGELTALWGISTASPRIPTEAEIKDALRTLPKDSAGIIPGKTRIDPGAVAKGYALDRAKAVLDNTAKTDYAVISTESSVLLYGEKPNGEPFTTGIKDPAGGLIGYVKTEAAFISTAGGAERFFTADGRDYIHILDHSTG